jgi:hypothetical protein
MDLDKAIAIYGSLSRLLPYMDRAILSRLLSGSLSRLLPYMEVCLDYCHIWKWGDEPSRAGAKHLKQKRSFFQPISFETKAIFFSANRVS